MNNASGATNISKIVLGVLSALAEDADSGLVAADAASAGHLVTNMVTFVLRNPDVRAPWVHEYARSMRGSGASLSQSLQVAWESLSESDKMGYRVLVALTQQLAATANSSVSVSATGKVHSNGAKRRGRPPKSKSTSGSHDAGDAQSDDAMI